MGVVEVVAAERAALLDLLGDLSDGEWHAATRCEGWDVLDLLAHLVVRQREPLTGPGLVIGGAPARYTERRRRRRRARGPQRLLDEFRHASVLLPAGPHVNVVEYFIHHEDVRRGELSRPRPALPDGIDRWLWWGVRVYARFLLAPAGIGGVLACRTPDGRDLRLDLRGRLPRATAAAPDVVVAGTPGELLLYLSGRRDVADVTLDGDQSAVERVRAAALRM